MDHVRSPEKDEAGNSFRTTSASDRPGLNLCGNIRRPGYCTHAHLKLVHQRIFLAGLDVEVFDVGLYAAGLEIRVVSLVLYWQEIAVEADRDEHGCVVEMPLAEISAIHARRLDANALTKWHAVISVVETRAIA